MVVPTLSGTSVLYYLLCLLSTESLTILRMYIQYWDLGQFHARSTLHLPLTASAQPAVIPFQKGFTVEMAILWWWS